MLRKPITKNTLASAKTGSKDSITSQRFFESQSILKISAFWGTEDYIEASDWIELYDMIAGDYNWTATNKMIRLGGYLKKHALVWFVKTIKTHPVEQTTWTAYKDLFVKRFSPALPERGPSRSDRSDASSVSSVS